MPDQAVSGSQRVSSGWRPPLSPTQAGHDRLAVAAASEGFGFLRETITRAIRTSRRTGRRGQSRGRSVSADPLRCAPCGRHSARSLAGDRDIAAARTPHRSAAETRAPRDAHLTRLLAPCGGPPVVITKKLRSCRRPIMGDDAPKVDLGARTKLRAASVAGAARHRARDDHGPVEVACRARGLRSARDHLGVVSAPCAS